MAVGLVNRHERVIHSPQHGFFVCLGLGLVLLQGDINGDCIVLLALGQVCVLSLQIAINFLFDFTLFTLERVIFISGFI